MKSNSGPLRGDDIFSIGKSMGKSMNIALDPREEEV